MSGNECSFVLDNDGALVDSMVTYLQDSVTLMGLCGEAERVRIGVALEAALVKAMNHGNLSVRSELRNQDDRAYYALIAQRRREIPYCNRRIHVDAELSR